MSKRALELKMIWQSIVSHSPRLTRMAELLATHKLPPFHLKPCQNAILNQSVQKFSELTSLPRSFRQQLLESKCGFRGSDNLLSLKAKELQPSAQCVKALFELEDGNCIEAVWMKFLHDNNHAHHSLCISSQVGCALKCSFCATGAAGFKRQLTTDEIIDQVLYFSKQGQSIGSISFMGMGECLYNPNVFPAIQVLTAPPPFGMGISERRLNVSTVGIIPGIRKLRERFPQVNLAFSLHSPFEEERNQLIPTNRIFPLPEVMRELGTHVAETKRKVMLAYLLLPGFNDTRRHADAIIKLIDKTGGWLHHLFHLNILRYNPAEGVTDDFKRTTAEDIQRFRGYFPSTMPITVRQSFGVEIDAACGQLHQIAKKKQAQEQNAKKQCAGNE